MFEVVLSRSAATFFQRLDRAWQERVRAALESLREDPFGHSKALVNGEGRRYPCGRLADYLHGRHSAKVVAVSHIGPRGQVYRRL
jgi:mRNA-degrading endonuclease RelE of RelBE toxin-antitoxin system